jgi:hypothetical protein
MERSFHMDEMESHQDFRDFFFIHMDEMERTSRFIMIFHIALASHLYKNNFAW